MAGTTRVRDEVRLSSDTATAFRFTGTGRNNETYSAMAYAEVPVERILASPFTGMGCLGEREFVITGGNMPIFVKALRRIQSKHLKHREIDVHSWLTADDEFSGGESHETVNFAKTHMYSQDEA